MHNFSKRIQNGFMHRFGKRGMRENGVYQFLLRRFQRARDDIALNHFRYFRTDHMRAEKLAGLGVKNCFDKAFGFAQRDRLAIAHKAEATDAHFASGGFRLGFGEP